MNSHLKPHIAKENEIGELRKLSTEKLIIWLVGRSKETGFRLTLEEVVLECWIINPEKHSLRGYRQFPCSRTVPKRVGEMKGKKAFLTGLEMFGYGLTGIAKRQFADINALVRSGKVDEQLGHSVADRQIRSMDEAPYQRLRKPSSSISLRARSCRRLQTSGCRLHGFQAIHLAMRYATPAARLPTNAVCPALLTFGTPVKCPFTKPNTVSASSVMTAETINARPESRIRM